MDLFGMEKKIQIMANARAYEKKEDFALLNTLIKRGDIIGARGTF